MRSASSARPVKRKAPASRPAATGMFLISPGGQFLAKSPYGKPVEEIVAQLREEIARRASADDSTKPQHVLFAQNAPCRWASRSGMRIRRPLI